MPETSRPLSKNISKTALTRRSGRVVFGDVIYAAGGRHGPRVQQDFQLVVVLTGEARVRAEGTELVVPARHVALLSPGRSETFAFSPRGSTHHAWCSVHPSLVAPELQEAGRRSRALQPLGRRLETLIELGLSVPTHATASSGRLLEALGLAALEDYVFSGRGSGAAPEPDALWRALEWVRQLGDRPADLAGMARAAGVSPTQLGKLFRTHLGTTPMRHVWKTRTERGVQLLQETGLSVAEAAYRCGFQTPFHFSRWVRRHFATSPRQLRKGRPC